MDGVSGAAQRIPARHGSRVCGDSTLCREASYLLLASLPRGRKDVEHLILKNIYCGDGCGKRRVILHALHHSDECVMQRVVAEPRCANLVLPKDGKDPAHVAALQGLVLFERTDMGAPLPQLEAPVVRDCIPPGLPCSLRSGTARPLSLRSCSLSVWEPAQIPTFRNDLGCSGTRAQRKGGSSREH